MIRAITGAVVYLGEITPGGSIEQMFGGGSYPRKFRKTKKGYTLEKSTKNGVF